MLRLRAAIEAGSGNYDAANKDLQAALALAPSNVNSLLNYASLQWKIGQKDAASNTFQKVLELDPRNRTALSSLGYFARDKGDAKLAETYFARADRPHIPKITRRTWHSEIRTLREQLPFGRSQLRECLSADE